MFKIQTKNDVISNYQARERNFQQIILTAVNLAESNLEQIKLKLNGSNSLEINRKSKYLIFGSKSELVYGCRENITKFGSYFTILNIYSIVMSLLRLRAKNNKEWHRGAIVVLMGN